MNSTVCGQPFTEAEWDDRHELHEPDCKRKMCDCDLAQHKYQDWKTKAQRLAEFHAKKTRKAGLT